MYIGDLTKLVGTNIFISGDRSVGAVGAHFLNWLLTSFPLGAEV